MPQSILLRVRRMAPGNSFESRTRVFNAFMDFACFSPVLSLYLDPLSQSQELQSETLHQMTLLTKREEPSHNELYICVRWLVSSPQ